MKEELLFLARLESQMEFGIEVGGQIVLPFADDVAHGVKASHVTQQKEELRAMTAVGELHSSQSTLHDLSGGPSFDPGFQSV